MCIILLLVYFASKILFSKVEKISEYQIINQFVLLGLLYFIMKCFIGIDSKLEKLPDKIKIIIKYLSELTLEIYVVQYVIIPKLAKVGAFPINWIVITFTILAAASVLHMCVKFINKQTDKLFIKEK